MKSKTLSCNLTLLRKDVFRFAPLWGIYLIGGLLVMLSSLSGYGYSGYSAVSLAETMGPFSIINLIYAGLVAQLLFGDLFNTRLCNALHALPMRRETWFCTHMIAGLAYSIVPHLIAALCFLPTLGEFGFIAFAWLLAMVLEYLFFFGLAVFCVFCTGNRFAMTAVYGIVNFASLIAYWFVTTIYEPLLYGVTISEEPFYWASPVVKMISLSDLLLLDGDWFREEYIVTYKGFGQGWGYLAICAGLGLVLLGIALLLYRRRKLESAGDFIAVKTLEPIFAVVFTLCVGCAFALFGELFDTGSYLLFLIVGLILGWFAGQMLLQRTVKVFRGKSFLKLAVLGLVLAASIGLTAWDPAGITTYVPEVSQVKTAQINTGRYVSSNGITETNPEKIADILEIHQQILEDRDKSTDSGRYFTVQYTLNSGIQVTRTYLVCRNTPAWQLLAALYSTPEKILSYTDWNSWVASINEVYVNGWALEDMANEFQLKYEKELPYDVQSLRTELLKALKADCDAGHLQDSTFEEKNDSYYETYKEFFLTLEFKNGSMLTHKDFIIPSKADNCWVWYQKYQQILDLFS